VRIGSVLFVHLIQPLGSGKGFPVPYRAVDFGARNRGTHGMVTLGQLQPRPAFAKTAKHFEEGEPLMA